MAQTSLLTDELLRRLISVGQVDIVLGVPTLNNAHTVAGALRAASEGLATYFPRERTVIVSADGGSVDGTPDIAAEMAAAAGRAGPAGLRTRHQVTTTYRGAPATAGAVQLLFAVADLLQARAIGLLDPTVTNLSPSWVASLISPVWRQSFDLVVPRYGRHPLEGLLVTQLIRPLMSATCGRTVEEPLASEFACSGSFAAHCLGEDVWEGGAVHDSIEPWLMVTALTAFRVCETVLGPRIVASSAAPRPLRDVFPLVVGSLFATLERTSPVWTAAGNNEPPVVVGTPPPPGEAPRIDASRLASSFPQDVRDLGPILQALVAPDTFDRISALAEAAAPSFPDDLWAATVFDFLAAHHRAVMDRTHIAQALLPLYLGRAGAFALRHASAEASDTASDLERLALEFTARRPQLIEQWNRAA